MKRRLTWLFCAAVAGGLSLSACSSSEDEEQTPPTDTGPDEDAGDTGPDEDTDPNEDIAPGDGLLGSLCLDDGECDSSFCVMLGAGPEDGVCSQRCEDSDSCLESWECKGVASGTGDVVNGCIPEGLCVDKDGDGYGIGPGCLGKDCDDNDPSVYFGAPEICDGKDNNCDGTIDILTVDEGRSCATGLHGVCGTGRTSCEDGVLECPPDVLPNTQPETCDGLDNDCDGLVDESRREDENDNFVLSLGDACAPDNANCMSGQQVCDPQRGGLSCQDANDPNDTLCNGIDDNCDGVIDSGVANLHEVCREGKGVCEMLGTYVCDTDPSADAICSAQPNLDAAHTEICDFLDNDCDGVIDGPFKNAQGRYHLTEHCGACGNNCQNLWQPSPEAFHVIPSCDASTDPPSCSYSCMPGWVDADDSADNGCELQPDEDAIYVVSATKNGEDTADCGDWEFPCATISAGILRAESANRSRVRVAAGTYREGLTIKGGISVLGGHSDLNWLRDIEANPTFVAGSASPGPDSIAVIAKGIQKATEISGFILTPPPGDAPSGASVGMLISGSGDKLTVKNNDIRANIGGGGNNGDAANGGRVGVSGNAGTGNGSDTTETCGGVSNRPGGAAVQLQCALPSNAQVAVGGGAGAPTQCPSTIPNRMGPLHSNPGLPATATAPMKKGGDGGPSYGAFGVWNGLCQLPSNSPTADDGRRGQDGSAGTGGNGGQASSFTVTTLGLPRPQSGGEGKLGYPGSGGGGGGAAPGIIWGCNESRTDCNGQRFIGASGGSGGSGGCGGIGGTGGTSGGASVSVVVHSPTSGTPILKNNILTRNFAGSGGAGASGGEGGQGGVGGAGGVPATPGGCHFQGRRGGDGGNGGYGGGGGGGAGGVSADLIFIHPSLATPASYEADNDFPVPPANNTAGIGGIGGFSPSTSGAQGQPGLTSRIRKIAP